MELELRTESGKCVEKLLAKLINTSAHNVSRQLKRLLFMFASKINKEDAFISALYGQSVLDESPLDLCQNLKEPVLRVQHAIEISLNKNCVKELVLALEWSENETILDEILKWAEKVAAESPANETTALDLAPVRAGRSLISIFSGNSLKSLKTRERKIVWGRENKLLTALEVYGNKIIIGWDSGQINIYNTSDLTCEKTFSYSNQDSTVNCLQCNGPEIIAAYSDAVMCVWDIESGCLAQKLSLDDSEDSEGCPTMMRLKNSKLVVVMSDGNVRVWQYVKAEFTFIGDWDVNIKDVTVKEFDFDENYIYLLLSDGVIEVFYFNGQLARKLRDFEYGQAKALDVALYNSYFITGCDDRVLRIWDINTGALLKELKGHKSEVICVALTNDCIASADNAGGIMLWSLEAALADRPATEPGHMPIDASDFRSQGYTHLTSAEKMYHVCIGRNFLVRSNGNNKRVVVTDFP